MAFDSVEHIMRDVNWGWLLRYMHFERRLACFSSPSISTSSSGMYYGSYKAPREVLWIIGVLIFVAL